MMKVAVAFRAWLIVTSQVRSAPVHAPPQPANAEPEPGDAVSVTTVPLSYSSAQVPADSAQPETAPLSASTVPSPVTVTVSGKRCTSIEVPSSASLFVRTTSPPPETVAMFVKSGSRVAVDRDVDRDVRVAVATGEHVGAGARRGRVVAVQPVPLIPVIVRSAGGLSTTVTVPYDGSAPPFETVTVYEPVPPWTKRVGVPLGDDEVGLEDGESRR